METAACNLVCNELLEPFGILNERLQQGPGLDEAQGTT